MEKRQKLKILFIVTLSELGGAQKYVRDLGLAYAREGHEVVVVAGRDPDGWLFRDISTYQHINISTYHLSSLKRSTGAFREFKTLFDMIRIIKNERPDILHLNSTKVGGLGGVAGRLTGVKSVYTVHGLVLNEPLPTLLWIFYWLLEKIAFAFCNKIIVISKYDEQSILKFHLAPKRKLSLIPLTIDPEQLNFLPREEARRHLSQKIKETRKQENSQPSTLYPLPSTLIGTVANFYPTKDLTTFIHAAKIVVQQKPETTFFFIGDGPLREKLESRIKNQGLENKVSLLGRLENSSQYLPGLDLFVLSSIKEGLPQVLQEATAAGLPIVSTDVGGIPDLFSKHTHYPWVMVKPNNPSLLAEKILFALDNLAHNPPKSKETLQREFLDFVHTTKSFYSLVTSH